MNSIIYLELISRCTYRCSMINGSYIYYTLFYVTGYLSDRRNDKKRAQENLFQFRLHTRPPNEVSVQQVTTLFETTGLFWKSEWTIRVPKPMTVKYRIYVFWERGKRRDLPILKPQWPRPQINYKGGRGCNNKREIPKGP